MRSGARHALVVAAAVTLVALWQLWSLEASSPAGAEPGSAPITGTFFIDLDRDGVFDPGEDLPADDPLRPPDGVAVIAYDSEGNSVDGIVEDIGYTIETTSLTGQLYRLEFRLSRADFDAQWDAGFYGPDSRSSVQFVLSLIHI